MILVAGACAVLAPGGSGAADDDGDGGADCGGNHSHHVALTLGGTSGSRRAAAGTASPPESAASAVLAPGDALAPAAFFAEAPAAATVRSLGICRVLCVPRPAYAALAAAFPAAAERVLLNLLGAAAAAAEAELRLPFPAEALFEGGGGSGGGGGFGDGAGGGDGGGRRSSGASGGGAAALRGALSSLPLAGALSPASRDSDDDGGYSSGGDDDGWGARAHDPEAAATAAALAAFERRAGRRLTAPQRGALADLVHARRLVEAHRARLLRERTAALLEAAARGDADTLRDLLRRGAPANAVDFSGQRTVLAVAARGGRLEAVEALLAAGADPRALGGCALLEATRGGHDAVLDALLAAGGRVEMGRVEAAAQLCGAVFAGDAPLLRRLLRAGLDADAGDYDGRRALHVAAAEGSLPAVSLKTGGVCWCVGGEGRSRGMRALLSIPALSIVLLVLT